MKLKTLVAAVALAGVTTSAFAAGQWTQKQIQVKVNPKLKVVVDGRHIKSDVEPFMYNDRVMVPMRAAAEAMGAEVGWDQLNSTVSITTVNGQPAGHATNLSPVAGTRIIPHSLSSDGREILESKLASSDYAGVMLATSWVAKNAPKELKTARTKELVKVIQDTQKLFINSDGSVKAQYELAEGAYKAKGEVDIKNQANMAYSLIYPHHSAMEGNYDSSVYASVHKAVPSQTISIAAYSLKNLADFSNGGFYKDLSKTKKDLSDQAYGLYALQPLVWLWEKHPDRLALSSYSEKDLKEFAVKTDDFLKKIWSAEQGIYASGFNPDGSGADFTETKYDLRTVGYLLWGHSLLHSLLKDSEPQRAAELEARARTFLAKVVVDGVTYKPEAGIPREIKVTNGIAGVGRDETNTGRLFDFVHAIFQYQRTIKDDRALKIAREMVILGTDSMHSDGVIIHDMVFSNPAQKSPVREIPYLGAYVTAAERLFDKLGAEEQKRVRKAIDGNYNFILKHGIR